MFKKLFAVLIVAVSLLTALTGCAQQSNSTAQTKELTFCESWDFTSGFYTVLTPEVSTNYGVFYYMPNFYETLVNYDHGKFVPGLAEKWDVSDDGLVYTFHLKKNVKFSDGAAFDAQAVKKNLEAIPKNLGKYNGSYGTVSKLIKQIDVVDANTVQVHLSQPYYGTLKDFTMLNPMGMVSPNALNADGSPKEELKTATFGTGAYVYQGETDGTTYTFVQNPEYWGEKSQIEQFHVKVIPDNDAKLLALRNGEIDIIVGSDKISYDGFNEMKTAGGFAATASDVVTNTRWIGFNVKNTPFDDPNVRLAASYGIDKQSICDSLFSGIETKADTLFDLSMPYCNVEVTPHNYDKQKAVSLLEEAGWKDSDGDGIREKNGVLLQGEMIYITGTAMIDDLALAVSAQLKEIGMDVKARGMEMLDYYGETMKNDFNLSLSKAYGISYDPYTFVTNMNSDLQVDWVAAQALALVENGNGILKELNATADESKIQQTYNLILTEVNDKAIFIPISYMKELAVYNTAKIEGYTFNGQPANVEVASIKVK